MGRMTQNGDHIQDGTKQVTSLDQGNKYRIVKALPKISENWSENRLILHEFFTIKLFP